MDLFVLIVTCAINLILGLFVLIRDVRKKYTQLFVSVCILLCVWIITNYITNHSVDNLTIANIANNLAFVSGYSILLCGLIFTYFFPVKRQVSGSEKIFVAVMGIIVIGLSLTEQVAGRVMLEKGALTFSTGSLIWIYILGFLLTIGVMTKNLLTVSDQDNKLKKRQALFILFAFTSTAVVGLVLNVIIPLFSEDWHTTRFGPLVTIILVATIAYTIIRHGLFDIRFAIVRGAAYFLSLLTLAFFYFVVAYIISDTVFQNEVSYISGQSIVNVILALVLAFIFQPLKRFFDRLTSRIFYRSNYSLDDFIVQLSRKLTSPTDLHSLLRNASEDIKGTLGASWAFFAMHHDTSLVSVGTDGHAHFKRGYIRELDSYFYENKWEILATDSLEDDQDHGEIQIVLREQKVDVVLPLWQADTLIGYLFMGEKRSGYYGQRDLKTLRSIRDELVIAIQNALSVQEVKEINATLQQRVDDATKELRASNLQLQRLDEAKDEFVSMASHQLRTPLTSVKGYISMVLEGDVGKISASQKKLLEEAFTSSERMVHLINDFLNVSRIQTGKFMLELRPIDLSKLLKQEVNSLKTTAAARSLEIRFKEPSYFPTLTVDEGKIRQVIMNFLDNAIYYSHEDSVIEVVARTEGGDAIIEVHDTGIGVPKEDQRHLFSKFFRAANARKQRPDGTGVGLFLAKKVIVAHGGSMVFESTEGKGSVFGFRLPIKKLSGEPADGSKKLEQQPDNH